MKRFFLRAVIHSVMLSAIAAALFSVSSFGAGDAAAATEVMRDRYGNRVGTAETDSRGKTVYRDKYGNRTGTSETDSRGRTVYRDRYGNRTGTAETDSRGKTTYRDKHGNRKGTRGR